VRPGGTGTVGGDPRICSGFPGRSVRLFFGKKFFSGPAGIFFLKRREKKKKKKKKHRREAGKINPGTKKGPKKNGDGRQGRGAPPNFVKGGFSGFSRGILCPPGPFSPAQGFFFFPPGRPKKNSGGPPARGFFRLGRYDKTEIKSPPTGTQKKKTKTTASGGGARRGRNPRGEKFRECSATGIWSDFGAVHVNSHPSF